jgi:hypothetical protein
VKEEVDEATEDSGNAVFRLSLGSGTVVDHLFGDVVPLLV